MNDKFTSMFPEFAAANLLDSIPHGIAVIDRDLNIVVINEFLEALTGITLADVKGVYVDFILRSNIAQRGRTFREVLANGEPLVIDGDIVSRDRRKVPMQFTISPLRDLEEEIVGLVIVLDDLASITTSAGFRSGSDETDSIIGQSPKMREIFDLIPLMAHTEASVLITGETDTRFLLNHFLRLFAERTGNSAKTFSDESLALLMDYAFPGNIRELRNIVEYCVNISQSQKIEIEQLPKYLCVRVAPPSVAATETSEPEQPSPTRQNTGKNWPAIEKDLIISALTQTRGNRAKTAEILGWGRTTLWRRLKTHGLVTSPDNNSKEEA